MKSKKRISWHDIRERYDPKIERMRNCSYTIKQFILGQLLIEACFIIIIFFSALSLVRMVLFNNNPNTAIASTVILIMNFIIIPFAIPLIIILMKYTFRRYYPFINKLDINTNKGYYDVQILIGTFSLLLIVIFVYDVMSQPIFEYTVITMAFILFYPLILLSELYFGIKKSKWREIVKYTTIGIILIIAFFYIMIHIGASFYYFLGEYWQATQYQIDRYDSYCYNLLYLLLLPILILIVDICFHIYLYKKITNIIQSRNKFLSENMSDLYKRTFNKKKVRIK